eukprot:4120852-Amphidinium_carterae.1
MEISGYLISRDTKDKRGEGSEPHATQHGCSQRQARELLKCSQPLIKTKQLNVRSLLLVPHFVL